MIDWRDFRNQRPFVLGVIKPLGRLMLLI